MKHCLVGNSICFLLITNISGLQICQAMAARGNTQRTCIWMNILKCDPNTTHKFRWITLEMHCITMKMLLSSHRKIQCLKGIRSSPIQNLKGIKYGRSQGKVTNRWHLLPCILQAHPPWLRSVLHSSVSNSGASALRISFAKGVTKFTSKSIDAQPCPFI